MAQRGEYNTLKKESVLRYLEKSGAKHITAEELVEALKQQGVSIGKTTAYRHLEMLTKQGLVSRFQPEAGGCACYQFTGAAPIAPNTQMHCICTKCGSLLHVSCELIQEMKAHFEKEHAFTLDPARTVLYGICEKCKEEDKNGTSDAE